MKRMKIENGLGMDVEVYVAENGKVLEVFYDGETEPVYYDRVCCFLIGELDIINEVDKQYG